MALRETSKSPNLVTLIEGLGLNPNDMVTWVMGGHRIGSVVTAVTPAIATEWLDDRNIGLDTDSTHGNRASSKSRADKYAEQMRSGLWRVSPQNVIAFDEEGFLLDGQHRLKGITRQSGAIEFIVQVGWPRNSFAVIDQVFVRRGSQLIPGSHRALRAAASRILVARTGAASASDGFAARAINPEIDLQWMGLWPELDAFASSVDTVYRATRINAPCHLAVLAMASRTEHVGRIDGWVSGLVDGAGLDSTDPRLHLRNRFLRDYRQLSGAGSGRSESFILIVKMWNAHVLGERVKLLKTFASENIPDVIGFDRSGNSTKRALR